jgi:2-polyprenyl-3-methyl-5-hydroxy-6-metoxy-1,4-benzoquinol methylase
LYVVGIDVAHGMVEAARKKRIPWLNVIKQRVEDSGYRDFDLVCAHGLLRHFEDPMIVVKRAYEALKKKALFFVEDLSVNDALVRITSKFSQKAKKYLKPYGRKTSFYLPDDELLRVVKNGGFELQNYRAYSYESVYNSLDEIMDFFLEETMFGLYTYRNIPPKHKERCNRIFYETLRTELEEATLDRHFFMALFRKI